MVKFQITENTGFHLFMYYCWHTHLTYYPYRCMSTIGGVKHENIQPISRLKKKNIFEQTIARSTGCTAIFYPVPENVISWV